MQEREQIWDSRYEDDKLWGAGITNMITNTMKGLAQCQEGRETEREMTARMDGRWLEASQHRHPMREVGPEKRQQLQQQPMPKLQLKLQSKLQPTPKQQSAPTPARLLETVAPKAKRQRVTIGPVPALTAGSSKAERCLISRGDGTVPHCHIIDQEIVSAIISAFFHQKAPANSRIKHPTRYAKSAITAITHANATARIALQ